MEFRFQEPDTDVVPVTFLVEAALEGERARCYVRQSYDKWGVFVSPTSDTPLEFHDSQGRAFEKARERCCREVKANVLTAAAQRVRGGHAP